MNLIKKVLWKILYCILYAANMLWLLIALIPLSIGIGMIDVFMRLNGVDKVMLLWTNFAVWVSRMKHYFEVRKKKLNTNKENFNNV